jgi:hypothetical protein
MMMMQQQLIQQRAHLGMHMYPLPRAAGVGRVDPAHMHYPLVCPTPLGAAPGRKSGSSRGKQAGKGARAVIRGKSSDHSEARGVGERDGGGDHKRPSQPRSAAEVLQLGLASPAGNSGPRRRAAARPQGWQGSVAALAAGIWDGGGESGWLTQQQRMGQRAGVGMAGELEDQVVSAGLDQGDDQHLQMWPGPDGAEALGREQIALEAPTSPRSFLANSPFLQPASNPDTPKGIYPAGHNAASISDAPGLQLGAPCRLPGPQRTPNLSMAQPLSASSWFLSPLLAAKDSPCINWKSSPMEGGVLSPQVSPMLVAFDSGGKRKVLPPLSPLQGFQQPAFNFSNRTGQDAGPKRARKDGAALPSSVQPEGSRPGGRFAMLSDQDVHQDPLPSEPAPGDASAPLLSGASASSAQGSSFTFAGAMIQAPARGSGDRGSGSVNGGEGAGEMGGIGASGASSQFDLHMPGADSRGHRPATSQHAGGGLRPHESPGLSAVLAIDPPQRDTGGVGGMIDQAVAAVKEWQSDVLKSPELRLATPGASGRILPLPSPLISPLIAPLSKTPLPTPKMTEA